MKQFLDIVKKLKTLVIPKWTVSHRISSRHKTGILTRLAQIKENILWKNH